MLTLSHRCQSEHDLEYHSKFFKAGYYSLSPPGGFPHSLQTPCSLITPIQVPSLHKTRLEKSSPPSSDPDEDSWGATSSPQYAQNLPAWGILLWHSGHSREGRSAWQLGHFIERTNLQSLTWVEETLVFQTLQNDAASVSWR